MVMPTHCCLSAFPKNGRSETRLSAFACPNNYLVFSDSCYSKDTKDCMSSPFVQLAFYLRLLQSIGNGLYLLRGEGDILP